MAIGILALADLASRYEWRARETAPFVVVAGLEPTGSLRRSFEPPRVVIAVFDPGRAHLLQMTQQWLARADRVLFVYDMRVQQIDVELLHPVTIPHAEVFTWMTDADVAPILARALQLDQPEPAPEPAIEPAVVVDRELAPGPWVAFAERTQQLLELAQHLDGIDFTLRSIPKLEFRRADRPGRYELHRDPVHPISWTGVRMGLYWFFDDVYLDVLAHDYPCGPAKKLYGFKDNDPLQICLAPTLEAFVARFDHDVTFSTAVPMRWQSAGAFEVAAFDRDLRRATFFARVANGMGQAQAPDEEDARDQPPALVLGPALYALDLTHEVWRIMRPFGHETEAYGDHVLVGGPNDGFAVFDFDHQLVRRATGQLLGGWYRHATLEDAGSYWREDLVTGARTRLGPADVRRCVADADEDIARDAILAHRLDDASRVRDGHPTTIDEPLGVLAVLGTRNIVIVTRHAFRVI